MDLELSNNYSNGLYAQLARIGKCISSEKRIEILTILSQGEKTVERIATQTEMSIANTSRHLQILKEAKLLTSERVGTFVYYKLASKEVMELIYTLKKVGESRLSDVKNLYAEFNNALPNANTLSLQGAIEKINNSDVMVIDLRDADEYNCGHISHAINIPIQELETNYVDLPKDKEIIFYCRGLLCSNAKAVSNDLNQKGFQTYSLDHNFLEYYMYLQHNENQ